MWSVDAAKRVLENANKVFDERRKLGIRDEALFETAQYLDYALTTYLWTEENARKKEKEEKDKQND